LPEDRWSLQQQKESETTGIRDLMRLPVLPTVFDDLLEIGLMVFGVFCFFASTGVADC